MILAGIEKVRRGVSVWIFPEEPAIKMNSFQICFHLKREA